jgi:sialidase-1
MKRRLSIAVFTAYIGVCLTTSLNAAEIKVEGSLEAFRGEPELTIQPVFKGGRFPNVVVTMKGTVLATWGSGHIRACRSEDGGQTWGDEITISGSGIHGGGTTVDETTGDILAFVEEKHPPAPLTVYRSKDEGKTWQADPVTIHPDNNGKMPSMHMNEHGITLRHGEHKGRLLRPSRQYGKGNRPASVFPTHYTNAMYSDDGGKTWRTSDPFPETELAKHVSPSCRTDAFTTTRGAIGRLRARVRYAGGPRGVMTAERHGKT